MPTEEGGIVGELRAQARKRAGGGPIPSEEGLLKKPLLGVATPQPPLRGLLNNPVQVTGGMEIHAAADTKPVPGL